MSSSFWSSSHCRYWLVTRSTLLKARSVDLQYASPRQLYCLGIWFANLIQKLGKRLMLRQTPIATATVLFRRFYTKSSYCETNPYLVLTACCFVAAKVEETPVHIKSVVSEAKTVFNEHGVKMFPAETTKVGEMEFYLLEDLDFHLVVFHPYRSLLHMTGREPADIGKFSMTRVEEDVDIKKKETEARRKRDDEARKANPASRNLEDYHGGAYEETEEKRIRRLMGRGSGEGLMDIDEGVLQISLFVLNDTYRTEVHLLYPPYVISLAALYIGFCLTAMNSGARTRSSSSQVTTLASSTESNASLSLPAPPAGSAEFLATFQVSTPVMLACVQDIIVLYPIWETFEPSSPRSNANPAPTTAALLGAHKAPGEAKDIKEKFTVEDAEPLLRRMIEDRAVDLSHPDDAGEADGAGQIAGRKRRRA